MIALGFFETNLLQYLYRIAKNEGQGLTFVQNDYIIDMYSFLGAVGPQF